MAMSSVCLSNPMCAIFFVCHLLMMDLDWSLEVAALRTTTSTKRKRERVRKIMVPNKEDLTLEKSSKKKQPENPKKCKNNSSSSRSPALLPPRRRASPPAAARQTKKRQQQQRHDEVVPPQLIRIPLSTPTTYGSICTGLGTDSYSARDNHGRNGFENVFTCENNPVAIQQLKANGCMGRMHFDNASSPIFHKQAPYVDVLTSGFPCQPYSSIGDNLGSQDVRSMVIHDIIRYIKRKLPRLVVLENVPGLLHRHQGIFLEILMLLKKIKDPITNEVAYFLTWKVLNTKTVGGVPQQRKRLYIVLVKLCGRRKINFQWPCRIPCKSLDEIFDAGTEKLNSYMDYKLPKQMVARRNVAAALVKV